MVRHRASRQPAGGSWLQGTEVKSPRRWPVLGFLMPCLLQGCWDGCKSAWAGSRHWNEGRMHWYMGCTWLLDAGCCGWVWASLLGHELAPGWGGGVTGSRDSWGECSAVLGGAASWELPYQGGCGIMCVILSPMPGLAS